MPGDKGGHGDSTTFDGDTGSVWLLRSPDHNVVVIDASNNAVEHVISGIEDGHGVGFGGDYAFIADNAKNVVVVVNKRTFEQVAARRLSIN